MGMIIPIVTVAVAALYARSEARNDAATIAADMEVNHVQAFLMRACLGILFALIMFALGGRFIFALALFGAAFSAVFRFMLNALREPERPWDYMSRSNAYDSLYIWLFNDAAGRMAYLVEGVVAFGCIVFV